MLADLSQRPRAALLLAAAKTADATHKILGGQYTIPLHHLQARMAAGP
jgi:hypothetical protein